MVARDTVVKAVLAINQSQFMKNTQSNKLNLSSSTFPPINSNILEENKSSDRCSKNLLNEIFSQMNYNDLKKQKIKQAKKQIWSSFIESCIQTSADPQTHLTNLCKQHKIIF